MNEALVVDEPYPGLRSFRRDETHIFFGRETTTNEMVRRLAAHRFLAVTGTSGSGKSSLVRTGLLDALDRGLLASAGADWRVADFRPGRRPMGALSAALIESLGITNSEYEALRVEAVLARGPRGLVEWIRDIALPPRTNLLLLVDQFEEIFRFRHGHTGDDIDAFVALLLASARQRELPIYVVITMRSDFLGDCAQFAGLAEAINDGQYLTPRLTREQSQASIEGPALVFGGQVESALVSRLLNDMGTNADQLPLAQHVLMRLWRMSAKRTGDDARVLRLKDYEKLGGIGNAQTAPVTAVIEGATEGGVANALSIHADEILAELREDQQQLAATLFRVLTESQGVGGRDVRRPVTLAEAAAVAGVPVGELIPVVDAFRAPGRNLLAPPLNELLRPETVIDISHESLIRQWGTLRTWLRDEYDAARTYRHVETTAKLWQQGNAALMIMPFLGIARAWRDREHPNATWAARYGDDFTLAMKFLDKSEEAERFDAERKLEEAKREAIKVSEANLEAAKKDRERARRQLQAVILGAIGVVLIACVVFLLYSNHQTRLAMEQQRESARQTAELAAQNAALATQNAALATRNFEVAVTSAQKMLDQVGESLNHGDIGITGANDMLQVANGNVEQVHAIERTPETTELRVKLGWTTHDIYAHLGNLAKAYDAAKSARDLAEPLYASDPDAAFAAVISSNNPKVLTLLYNSIWRMGDAIADRDVERRTQELGFEQFRMAEKLARRLVEIAPDNPHWQRDVAYVLLKIGDVNQALEEWQSAIAIYSEALTIMQSVIARAPQDREWQRELANTHDRLGQALAGNGDLDAAMQQYGIALKKRTELAVADKDDNVAQSNLATSHRDIARLYAKRGDFDAALAQYRLAIGIVEGLLKRDPANATWQIALAPLYVGVSELFKNKGDLATALVQYRQAYTLRRELSLRDPAISARQYSYATAGISVADLLVTQNQDLDDAAELYRAAIETLDILQQQLLKDKKPRSELYERDVFRCYLKIGDILKSGDMESALKEYKKAQGIAEASAKEETTGATWEKNLAEAYAKIGQFLVARGHRSEALGHYNKALEFVEARVAEHPENAGWAALTQFLKAEIEKLG
jgi:tetratricopeptide (TPR) repeat protein